MTSVQSMVFQAFECAPSSVVRVVDSLAPSYAVGDDFQNFLSGTIDRYAFIFILLLLIFLSMLISFDFLCIHPPKK